jgi:hypothetical protein
MVGAKSRDEILLLAANTRFQVPKRADHNTIGSTLGNAQTFKHKGLGIFYWTKIPGKCRKKAKFRVSQKFANQR